MLADLLCACERQFLARANIYVSDLGDLAVPMGPASGTRVLRGVLFFRQYGLSSDLDDSLFSNLSAWTLGSYKQDDDKSGKLTKPIGSGLPLYF